MDSETKLWHVKPTGSPSSMPDTMVTPVANMPMASLNRAASNRAPGAPPSPGAHRFLSSKVAPSLAALTSTFPVGLGHLPGAAQHGVELAVGVGRVVVEHVEPPDAGLGGHLDGVGRRRVPQSESSTNSSSVYCESWTSRSTPSHSSSTSGATVVRSTGAWWSGR